MQEWLSTHISMASAWRGISFQVLTAQIALVRVTIRGKNAANCGHQIIQSSPKSSSSLHCFTKTYPGTLHGLRTAECAFKKCPSFGLAGKIVSVQCIIPKATLNCENSVEFSLPLNMLAAFPKPRTLFSKELRQMINTY